MKGPEVEVVVDEEEVDVDVVEVVDVVDDSDTFVRFTSGTDNTSSVFFTNRSFLFIFHKNTSQSNTISDHFSLLMVKQAKISNRL